MVYQGRSSIVTQLHTTFALKVLPFQDKIKTSLECKLRSGRQAAKHVILPLLNDDR